MRNNIIFILALCGLFISCQDKTDTPLEYAMENGFVHLKNDKFYIGNKEYFPLSLNYKVSLRKDKESFFPSPSLDYFSNDQNNKPEKDSCLYLLSADFQMIKDMGFNSLRIVGIGENLEFIKEPKIDAYLNAVEELFEIARMYDLKIVYLLPMRPKKPELFEKYKPLLEMFKEDNNILAYDFFNEPVYFDTLKRDRTKVEAYEITKEWEEYVDEYAPYQLLTIGLTGPREVMKWDPNLLNVDFLSFHPYEYAENMVMRDLYWFGKVVEKPWIIGETAISADNDSVPYSKQKQFAKKITQETVNNGGIGFTWWQYKDVDWSRFFANYNGLVSHEGKTNTSNDSLVIYGTPKETIEVFQKFQYTKTRPGEKPKNYYNSYENNDFKLTGKIIDEETKKPIENAIVVAWNQWWSKSFVTFTKEDGTFELMGPFEFYHYKLSATRKALHKGDFKWKKLVDVTGGIPTVNIGVIELKNWRE